MKMGLVAILLSVTIGWANQLDFYFKTSRIYEDILPHIPQMKGLYTDGPNGGISYMLSESSGKDFCWLKSVDSNGTTDIKKFYIDWTNEKYTPETYGRVWNDMCKRRKSIKRFANTDSIIQVKIANEYPVVATNSNTIYVGRVSNDFDYYTVSRLADGNKWYSARIGILELVVTDWGMKNDTMPVIIGSRIPSYINVLKYKKSDLCIGVNKDDPFMILADVFLRKLIEDGFLMISCE
jgi:hypothetical protein